MVFRASTKTARVVTQRNPVLKKAKMMMMMMMMMIIIIIIILLIIDMGIFQKCKSNSISHSAFF